MSLAGVPHHPKWDFIWSEMLFHPDPTQRLPTDVGGWCHAPYSAAKVGSHPQLIYPGFTRLGPAMGFKNAEAQEFGNTWDWTDGAIIMGTPGTTRRQRWTFAVGWEDEKTTSSNWHEVLSITTQQTPTVHRYRLNYRHIAHEYRLHYPPSNWSEFASGYTCAQGSATYHTFVATIDSVTGETKCYADGRLVKEIAAGAVLPTIYTVVVGGPVSGKQPASWYGRIGPLLITHGAWTPADVRLWAADPYGFLEPEPRQTAPWWPEPRSDIKFDTQVRPAVTDEAQVRPAVTDEEQVRATVTDEEQVRPAVTDEEQVRPAVSGDVQVRRE
jgi:hypothetical protein